MKKFLSMLLAVSMLLSMTAFATAEGSLSDAELAAIEQQSQKVKANVIITNDGECDDMDSMIRYLNYANEFNTKAVIISSSSYHWTGGTIIDPATGEPARYDEAVHGPKEPYEDSRGRTVTPDVDPFEYTSKSGETYEALRYKQSRWTGLAWYDAYYDGYEASYENLVSYDPSYPTPDYLRSVTYLGNIKYKGEMLEETEGSVALESLLLNNEDGVPLYVLLWGGCNTVARALLSIEEDYKGTDKWDEIYSKICDEVVFYMILNQDDTYGNYISVNWPDTKFVHNSGQFWSFAYMKSRTPDAYYHDVFGTAWSDTIVKIGSPLLDLYLLNGTGWDLRHISEDTEFNKTNAYYTWNNEEDTRAFYTPELNPYNAWPADEAIVATWGENENRGFAQPVHEDCTYCCVNADGSMKTNYTQGEEGYFISEGDSPAFFYLLDNGLRSNENPVYGGWGGRFVQESDTYWTDKGCQDYNPYGVKAGWGQSAAEPEPGMDANYTQTRWFPDIQNDFTARAQWTITKDGNLAPKSGVVNGLDLTAKAGETIVLDGAAVDPNGDNLGFTGWQYFEVDTYAGASDGALAMTGADTADLTLTVPADAQAGDTIHLIFEVEDDNATPLKIYKRVIITVAAN